MNDTYLTHICSLLQSVESLERVVDETEASSQHCQVGAILSPLFNLYFVIKECSRLLQLIKATVLADMHSF